MIAKNGCLENRTSSDPCERLSERHETSESCKLACAVYRKTMPQAQRWLMYLYVKAVHVFAVVLLIGGTPLLALTIRIAYPKINGRSRQFVEGVLRWDNIVTTPALAVVWLAGFTMAFGAGWNTSTWLLLKMVPVVFLTGLHNIAGLVLRRGLREGLLFSPVFHYVPAATLLAFAAIVWLPVPIKVSGDKVNGQTQRI